MTEGEKEGAGFNLRLILLLENNCISSTAKKEVIIFLLIRKNLADPISTLFPSWFDLK